MLISQKVNDDDALERGFSLFKFPNVVCSIKLGTLRLVVKFISILLPYDDVYLLKSITAEKLQELVSLKYIILLPNMCKF